MFSLNIICKGIFAGFFCLLVFISCTTVKETLYLREAKVSGPIMPAPIHLTDSTDTPSITISPRFSYNTNNKLVVETKEWVPPSYVQDSIPSTPGLIWDMATINAGVDMDLALSRSFALSFGVNYSSQDNFNSIGGNFGIGLFSYKEGTAIRFDVGLQIHSMRYDAFTIVHGVVEDYWGGSEEYTVYYHDIGESTHLDPYLNLTFNTAFKSWPVNMFINAGYVVQTLFAFNPKTTHEHYGLTEYYRTDKRGEKTAGFLNITPGIYFYLGDSNRVLIGSRIYIETQIEGAEPNLFILPMIQFDFVL
jgi:hypothetical protein